MVATVGHSRKRCSWSMWSEGGVAAGIVEARLVPGWTLGPRRAGRATDLQADSGQRSVAAPPRAERSWDPGSHRSPTSVAAPWHRIFRGGNGSLSCPPRVARKAIHDPSPPMPAPLLHYSCENSPLSTALHDCQASSVPVSNSHDFQNYL